MSILDTFYILFDSDSSKLDKGLVESEKKAEKLTENLGDVDKAGAKAGATLYQFIGKAAGLLGLGVSVGALVSGIKETAAAYDELGKLAARFRSTTDAVDEFRDASELLGISEEKSTGALLALDTAIQDTFLGLGRAKKVFEELDISVTDAAGKIKPTTAVMGELAAKLHGMERGTQIRVMERLGLDPSLLKLFNADMVALQKRMADVDRASGFNLDQAVKRSAEYTKASKALSLEVNVLKMFLEKLQEGFKLNALPYFTKGMELATKYLRMFSDFAMKHSKLIEGFFVAISGAILYFLVPAAIQGAIAVWAMIAPFALIGAAVIAVATAFALLYEDVVTFMEGGDSMIGNIVKKWPIVGEIIKALGAELRFLLDVAKAVWDFFVGMWDDPSAAFEKFKSDIAAGLNTLAEKFPGLREVIDAVSSAFSAAGSAVADAWGAVVSVVESVVSAVSKAIQMIVSGYDKVKPFLGLLGPVGAAVSLGQNLLNAASSAPMAAQTSNSINNMSRGGRTTTVQVDKVEVRTQATDAAGISKAIGGTLTSQMRQAVANFDDGVLG